MNTPETKNTEELLKKVKEAIKTMINDAESSIFERAERIIKDDDDDDKLSEEDKTALLDIDMDDDIFCLFDKNDMENHNFDAGMRYAANEILEIFTNAGF